jgi:hypothetical protein
LATLVGEHSRIFIGRVTANGNLCGTTTSSGNGNSAFGDNARGLVTWFQSRPIAVHTWKDDPIESNGVTAKLKTEWDGYVRYQLELVPSSNDLNDAFTKPVQANRGTISFTISLVDEDGFLLCVQKDISPHLFRGPSENID